MEEKLLQGIGGIGKIEEFLRNGLGNGFQFSSGIKKTEEGIQKEEG